MSDAPLTECPECHKATLQKLVSAAGFQLKGTGWYVTDFKNKPGSGESNKKTTTSTSAKTETSNKKDDSSSSSSSTSGGTTA
jgi:predicted nucleic acid-binding Zn ribbon protein